MFADLLSRLTGAARAAPLAQDDARLALAALLVRVARADDDYAQTEIDHIDRILAAHHGLSPFEAAALRGRAESLESEAPDTVRFTRALKNAVALEDRIAVIEALWAVVLADGGRDMNEDTFLRMVASLLGVSDGDSARARQRAARQTAAQDTTRQGTAKG
ncbi:MAG: hypothetical protein CSA70_01375 [Rhodobacterales bacterium]|nr:MAG: hypothetical protein CSA70_01375 [Rhodobacterales bacterium]